MTLALIAAPDVIEHHFLRRGKGAEFEMEAAWIRRRLPDRARRVLDIGCGGGALLATIGFERALGMDLQASGLAFTRRRFPNVPLVCGSADRISLSDGSVDAITLQHVIEHLPDVGAALAEWARVLVPGGTLLIQTPNAAFVDPRVFDDPTHVHVFTKAELGEAVSAAGFEIHDLTTIGLPWFRGWDGRVGGWRLRRFVLSRATMLAQWPGLGERGQTLCCAARRATR